MSGGPGQLILATAAAVVGFYLGGPAGAAAGFTLGMTVGGIIWPMDGGTQTGPRLADREVQSSAYGMPIPVIFGSYRLSGNVVWCRTGGIEERSDFKRVGKTLFSKGTKVWSYTYFAHFAVAVCEGPVSSIGRIWADSKLIYDPDKAGKYDKYLTFYLGTEDQLPHPTIQADKGIANTPAFRGTAMVVFDGLPLADFSNRIPTISIEIGALPIPDKWTDGSVPNISGQDWTYNPAQPGIIANTWGDYVTVINTTTLQPYQFVPKDYRRTWLTGGNTEGAAAEPPEGYIDPIGFAATEMFGEIYGGGSFGSTLYARPAIDPASGDVIVFLQGVTSRSMITRWRVSSSYPALVYARAFFTEFAVGRNYVFGNRVWMVDQFQDVLYTFTISTGAEEWRTAKSESSFAITGPIGSATYRASDGSVYFTRDYSGGAGNYLQGGIARQNIVTGEILNFVTGFLPGAGDFAALYDLATDSVIIVCEQGFVRLDPVSLAVTETHLTATPWNTGGAIGGSMLENAGIDNAVSGSIWLSDGGLTANAGFWQISTAPGFPLLWTDSTDAAIKSSSVGFYWPIHLTANRPSFFSASGGTQVYKFGNEGGAISDLATIVADLCDRCGMEPDDIDVSAIAGKAVPGYGVLRESTGRAALEPLLSAYAVDAPESDGKLRFRFRQTDLQGTIPAIDLGTVGDGSQAIRIEERRKQEIELPAAVTVAYSSRARDYQTGTQSTKRINDAIEAGDPRSVEFPLVLDDGDAQTLASRLLYLAWIERTSFSFSLPPRWVIHDPGDVLDLPLEDGSAVRVLLTKVELGGDMAVRCSALATDDLAYLPPPQDPIVPIFPGQSVPVIEPMELVVIDGPLLDEADDTFGLYLGGDGQSAGWDGGTIYASQDGTAYEIAASVAAATPVGHTLAALPSHPSALIDRVNVLTVIFDYDPGLSSITELELLAGGNLLMVGTELLGFATATSLGGGMYTLSTLRRGIQGTEWASSHTGGDYVVMVENLSSIDLPLSDLGKTTWFKGVTLGEFVDDQDAETIVGAGARLKPLSPVHISGARDGDGNLSISWVRRARLDPDWRDLVETPLDEPVELYELDVMNGSAVVRTLTTSSPSASYAASDQAGDFGSPQASISIRIYQISSRVGRGYPGSATI